MKHCSIIFLLIISLTMLFGGCGRKSIATMQMDLAQSVIEEDPDSAYLILSNIPVEDLISDQEKARHALMMLETYSRMRIEIFDDSLSNVAVDYYSKKGKSLNLLMSIYYKAEICKRNNMLPEAIDLLLKGKEMAIEYQDYYWVAKHTQLMSDVFAEQHNYDKVLELVQETMKYFKLANKTRHYRFSVIDLGLAYANIGDVDRGLSLVDSITKIAESSPVDSALLYYGVSTTFQILTEQSRFEQAQKCIENIPQAFKDRIMDTFGLAHAARVYINSGDLERGLDYLRAADRNKITEKEKAITNVAWCEFYEKQGDWKKACEYKDSILKFINSQIEYQLKEPLVSEERDYFIEKAENEHLRSVIKSYVIIGCILLFILLSFIGIVVYKLKVRAKNAELEVNIKSINDLTKELSLVSGQNLTLNQRLISNQDEIRNLKQQIDTQEGQIKTQQDKVHKEMASLFKEQWTTLNSLSSQYFEKNDTPSTRATLIRDIEHEIIKLNNDKAYHSIEQSVNRYMENVIDEIRTLFPKFKEMDIRLLTLDLAGLSPRIISHLLNITIKNFYAKKSRLKERIFKCETEDYNYDKLRRYLN